MQNSGHSRRQPAGAEYVETEESTPSSGLLQSPLLERGLPWDEEGEDEDEELEEPRDDPP